MNFHYNKFIWELSGASRHLQAKCWLQWRYQSHEVHRDPLWPPSSSEASSSSSLFPYENYSKSKTPRPCLHKPGNPDLHFSFIWDNSKEPTQSQTTGRWRERWITLCYRTVLLKKRIWYTSVLCHPLVRHLIAKANEPLQIAQSYLTPPIYQCSFTSGSCTASCNALDTHLSPPQSPACSSSSSFPFSPPPNPLMAVSTLDHKSDTSKPPTYLVFITNSQILACDESFGWFYK